jgi:hypothetical protein
MNRVIVVLLLIFAPSIVFAANTTGYAWSESLGWFDFSRAEVTDTALTGHAYNDNTGWVVLSGVSNSAGDLSGYAWSESVGYFDFANVSIENGAFSGYAYNDNTGWLSFESGTNVSTAWRTVSATATATAPIRYAGGAYYGGGSSSASSEIPFSLRPINATNPTNTINIPPISINAMVNSAGFGQRSSGANVRTLQQFLNKQGFTVSLTGPGSVGSETTYFGPATRQALIKFQIKNNILPATGYFGPKTKALIKSLQ